MTKVLDDPALTQTTYYFKFYLFRAVEKAGLADRYLDLLAPWKAMLDLGLTTWAEKPEPTRSDSHAWSAHPTVNLLTLVAGIEPATPGFETVRIRPAPRCALDAVRDGADAERRRRGGLQERRAQA